MLSKIMLLLIVSLLCINCISSYECFITKDICPNENVTFHLYTKSGQDQSIQLDMANPKTVLNAKYAKGYPLVVLIHGYTGHKDFAPSSFIRPAYLDTFGQYNIISIDYNPLVRKPCYIHAVENLRTVAKCLGQLIDFMVDKSVFKLADIHIIGFSLGSHTAGMVSQFIKSGKLKRITALDPAKPLFMSGLFSKPISPDDAEFVDVIHTDVLARGMLRQMGHVDFYINRGIEQPGCELENDTGSCNHNRAPIYFAESIYSTRGFWGFKCETLLDLLLDQCRADNSLEIALMGLNVSHSARGLYHVPVKSEAPFALGILDNFQLPSYPRNDLK